MQALAGDRVVEGELPGVEHEAAGLGGGLAVDGIADERGAFVMEVDADLVGAAGVEMAEDERGEGGGVGGEDFVIGDGGLAAGRIDDGHFLAVHGVAADVGEDAVLRGLRDALGDGEVEFFHGPAGELADERLVGDVRLGDDDAAGGVLIQPVDDAGALDAADAGELALAMMQQGIDQRAVGISRCRMDDHAGALVEDDQIVILEEDFQREVLRGVVERDGFGDDDGDAVAEFHGVARLGGAAVELDVLLADERLDARAGKVRKAGGEEGVDALARTVIDLDFHGGSVSGRKWAASSSSQGKRRQLVSWGYRWGGGGTLLSLVFIGVRRRDLTVPLLHPA